MSKKPGRDPEVDIIERIYDALDDERFEDALDIVHGALAADAAGDPVVLFFGGRCLLELNRPDDAAAMLGKAAALDPDDPDLEAALAYALFKCCRFDDSEAAAARTLELDDASPDGHQVTALLLERTGRLDEADRHLERAAELDPERYARPLRVTHDEFERHIEKAREILGTTFNDILDEVAVIVEPLPSDAILFDDTPPLDPELLGLFSGVPRSEPRSLSTGREPPPRILLFQRTLERFFTEPGELEEEIATTLYHELAHYIGKEEDDMEELRLL
jgi:predicted Zn-dependent protease with MMP-like domain